MAKPSTADPKGRSEPWRSGWDCALTEWLDGWDRDPEAEAEATYASDADREQWREGYHTHWDELEAA